jgi:hypothetical protein
MALSVPQPTLAQDGASGTALSAAKPIAIACAPAFADGTPLAPPHVSRSAFVLYRRPAGAALQAWSSAAGAWQAGDPSPAGDALFPDGGGWHGMIVPAGQKDAAGSPVFDPAAAATYSVACFFAGTDAAGETQAGASPRSASFTVVEPGHDQRGGLAVSPQDPAQATRLTLFLRDASLADRATVTLDSGGGGGYSVTLAAGGSVVRVSDAGIALAPAPGAAVRVDGLLEIVGSLSLNGVVTT